MDLTDRDIGEVQGDITIIVAFKEQYDKTRILYYSSIIDRGFASL